MCLIGRERYYKRLCIIMIASVILTSIAAIIPSYSKNEVRNNNLCSDPDGSLMKQESRGEKNRNTLDCSSDPDKKLISLFLFGIINIDELTMWVLGADRRIIVLKMMHEKRMIQASDIADSTDRSLQNISYAMRELEKHGLIKSLTPGKKTWRRFIPTEKGTEVFENLKKNHLIGN